MEFIIIFTIALILTLNINLLIKWVFKFRNAWRNFQKKRNPNKYYKEMGLVIFLDGLAYIDTRINRQYTMEFLTTPLSLSDHIFHSCYYSSVNDTLYIYFIKHEFVSKKLNAE